MLETPKAQKTRMTNSVTLFGMEQWAISREGRTCAEPSETARQARKKRDDTVRTVVRAAECGRNVRTTCKGARGNSLVYVSDFGEHRIVPNRFVRDRTITVLDMDYWAVAYYRKMQQMEIAKTGDAEKRLILAEYTLVSRNEAASGKVTDATT